MLAALASTRTLVTIIGCMAIAISILVWRLTDARDDVSDAKSDLTTCQATNDLNQASIEAAEAEIDGYINLLEQVTVELTNQSRRRDLVQAELFRLSRLSESTLQQELTNDCKTWADKPGCSAVSDSLRDADNSNRQDGADLPD